MRSLSFVLTHSSSLFLEAPASSCHRGSAQSRAPTRLAWRGSSLQSRTHGNKRAECIWKRWCPYNTAS